MSDGEDTARAVADAMYAADHASQRLGMEMAAVAPGAATLTMNVTRDMVNGLEVCHGGIVFTLADSAMAFASNSYNDISFAFAANIVWLRPARLGDTLTAIASEREAAGRTRVYDVVVTNQSGETVATFRGTTRSTDRPLVDDQSGR